MSIRPSVRGLLPFALALLAAPVVRAEKLVVPSTAFPTIQSAVTAADAGDVIAVKKGVYTENVFVFQAGVTLRGKKAVIDGGFDGPCLTVAAADVTVTGFTLVNGTHGIADDFVEGGLPPDGLVVDKCEIRACGIGIGVTADGLRIERTTVRDCTGTAMNLRSTGPTALVVARNRLEGIRGLGIVVQAVAVELDRNEIRRCGVDGMQFERILPEGGGVAAPSSLSRNEISGCLGNGLFVASPAGAVDITDNELVGNRVGLTLEGQGFVVRDNACRSNVEEGMVLGTLLDHLAISTVVDNEVRGNGDVGIRITGPVTCRVEPGIPNMFVGNDVRDNGADGISITHAHLDLFFRNLVRGNAGDGIDIDAPLFGVELAQNRFLKNEHEGVDNGGQSTVMRDNRCTGNARGIGPDIAGTGDLGAGSVVDEGGNVFDTGGFLAPSRLDL